MEIESTSERNPAPAEAQQPKRPYQSPTVSALVLDDVVRGGASSGTDGILAPANTFP